MRIQLKVILSDGRFYDWGHKGTAISIGRDPECDLAVEDSQDRYVSWMHARIEPDGSSFLLRDYRSKNGTYVNDVRVEETHLIKTGDTVRLGQKGPKLIVMELAADCAGVAAAQVLGVPASRPLDRIVERLQQWGRREWALIVGGAVATVLLILIFNLLTRTSNAPQTDTPVANLNDGSTKSIADPNPNTPPLPEPKPSGSAASLAKPSGSVFSPRSSSSPPQQYTHEELAQRYMGAIVWLGAEFDRRRLPLCSGFAVDGTKIISTGHEIAS